LDAFGKTPNFPLSDNLTLLPSINHSLPGKPI
jgi:hypothetical protein